MENLLTTVVLAFSMFGRCFLPRRSVRARRWTDPVLREALRTGFVFGIIEAITPVIGWSAGPRRKQLYYCNRSLDRLRSTRWP